MTSEWERFVQDKKYIRNVTAKTISDYECAWNAWGKWLPENPKDITEETIRRIKIGLQEAKLSPISVNSYLKVLRTFLRELKICGKDGSPLPVPPVLQPKLVPPTYTQDQLQTLLSAPTSCMSFRRVQLLAKIYLDTGARAEEILKLPRTNIDLDNHLIKLTGKGRKERIVPFSQELRADLYRWMQLEPDAELLFPRLSYRNALRDWKILAKKVGVTGRKISFHTLRHTMATGYIATGGNVLYLQRLLGHASLEMTKRYVDTQTKDLANVHERHSLLAQLKRRGRG